MARRSSYPQELRERAVQLVAESRGNYDTEWAAMGAVATKLGICSTETLRKWCRQAEIGRRRARRRSTATACSSASCT